MKAYELRVDNCYDFLLASLYKSFIYRVGLLRRDQGGRASESFAGIGGVHGRQARVQQHPRVGAQVDLKAKLKSSLSYLNLNRRNHDPGAFNTCFNQGGFQSGVRGRGRVSNNVMGNREI